MCSDHLYSLLLREYDAESDWVEEILLLNVKKDSGLRSLLKTFWRNYKSELQIFVTLDRDRNEDLKVIIIDPDETLVHVTAADSEDNPVKYYQVADFEKGTSSVLMPEDSLYQIEKCNDEEEYWSLSFSFSPGEEHVDDIWRYTPPRTTGLAEAKEIEKLPGDSTWWLGQAISE